MTFLLFCMVFDALIVDLIEFYRTYKVYRIYITFNFQFSTFNSKLNNYDYKQK